MTDKNDEVFKIDPVDHGHKYAEPRAKYYSENHYHRLYAQLKEAFNDGIEHERKKAQGLVEALEKIQLHYQHPEHDHNWAFYTKELVDNALKEYRGGK